MEITKFKEINKGCLKCAMTVCIPEWGSQEVDCTYFEKDSGQFWINYAPREYTNKEGVKKSFNQVRWPPQVVSALNEAIRKKLTEYMKNKPTFSDDTGLNELPF